MIKVPQLLEVRVLHELGGCPSLILVINQHFRNDVLALRGDMRYQMIKPFKLLWREVNLHVSCVFPEVIKDFFRGCAEDIMNLVDLVELIISWEEWAEGEDFVHNATDTPDIHFVTVIAVGQKALWGSVPSSGDVFGEWLILVEAPTTAKIGKLHHFAREQNIFRFDIPMKNSISVHMLNRLQQLVHVVFDPLFGKIVWSSLNGFI